MPRKKAPKAGRPGRKAAKRPGKAYPRRPMDRRVEDFAEEMGRLGERATRAGRERRLYRSGKDKILGGVCGGIAEYFRVDPVFVRLLWVLVALAWGTGVLLYLIAWIIIPRNPRHKW